MLKNDLIANNPSLVSAVSVDGFSDAFDRRSFFRTSFHCPGRELVIQVSNKEVPDEEAEEDWFEPGQTASGYPFVWTDVPAVWMRVRGVVAGDIVYINSVTTQPR